MNTRITFNGKEYESPEAMPPDIRQAYERAMEIAKKGGVGGIKSHVNIKLSTNVRFVNDGQVHNSLDEMPADVRQKDEIAMRQIHKNQSGIPDFLEGDSASPPEADPSASDPFTVDAATPIAPMTPQPSVITPDRSNGTLIVVAGLIIIALLLVIFGLFLYIYQH
jgi:hypothetical protein